MKNDFYYRILYEIEHYDMNSLDMMSYIHGACDVALSAKLITSSERADLLSIAINRYIYLIKEV